MIKISSKVFMLYSSIYFHILTSTMLSTKGITGLLIKYCKDGKIYSVLFNATNLSAIIFIFAVTL